MEYNLKCAVWETTLKCNLNCSHCGSRAGKERKNGLSTREAINLCEQLAGINCETVALMGGELFLRKDWYEIANCITELGMKLSIVSNGTILKNYIQELKELQPNVVGISIDGMKKNHEKIRGKKGLFNESINAINLLRRNKIQTTVITTVSKINFKDLPLLKKLFYNKGINWQIQIVTPFGNFKEEHILSYAEFYTLSRFIASINIKSNLKNFPVIGAHCIGYYSKNIPTAKWNGCTAGISTLGITSDGDLVGCLAMGNDRFIEGNIRKIKLDEVWNNSEFFSYNRKFTMDKLGSYCSNCSNGSTCRGGCNSVSYSTTQALHNDPYCLYRIEREEIEQ